MKPKKHPGQLELDLQAKPAEKSEDVEIVIAFSLLNDRKRIFGALAGLTHFEGGQKPLYADLKGVRENMYIKSANIEEARRKLIELLGDEKIEIISGRSELSGKAQLLIREKKEPVKGKSHKQVHGKGKKNHGYNAWKDLGYE